MALWELVLVGLINVLVFVLMPVILMVALFVLSRRYRGMFDLMGLSRKEVGLLIFGSLAASFFSIDVPFLVFGNSLLAVNVAGAVIPTVLSIHLLRAKRIHVLSWALGILGVALVTFMITRVQPNAGIVAEFPWMFLPSLSAVVLALFLYGRASAKAPAYAYATATLGSLIGADVFHMPELFATQSFVGSLGGAGVYDLVYLAGVVSLALVLAFAASTLRRVQAKPTESERRQGHISDELAASVEAYVQGRWQASVRRTLSTVNRRLRQLAPAWTPVAETAQRLLAAPAARSAYHLLAQQAAGSSADRTIARWAMYQGEHLLRHLEKQERARYAHLGRRVLAFLIDAGIMAVLAIALAGLAMEWGRGAATDDVLLVAIALWIVAIQTIYFTLWEWLAKGYTPGKRALGIRVTDEDGRPPDFITAFARNVVRMAEFWLLLYGVALAVIALSRRLQRVGDMVAQSVVLGPAPKPLNPTSA